MSDGDAADLTELEPPRRAGSLKTRSLVVGGVLLVVAGAALFTWKQVKPVVESRKYAKVTYEVPKAPKLTPKQGETVYRIDPTRSSLRYEVQERFADYPQVRLVKGFLPDAFAQGCPEKIAYLHIDLNNAEGEIASLDHLWDRIVPGGMVVLDDYEWSGIYREQKRTEDLWFQQRGHRVFPLPTGQGFVIKR